MSDCVFCQIVRGEAPAAKIYEDDDVLAFLDIFPVSRFHTLVIPKIHYKNFLDVPPTLLSLRIIRRAGGQGSPSAGAPLRPVRARHRHDLRG